MTSILPIITLLLTSSLGSSELNSDEQLPITQKVMASANVTFDNHGETSNDYAVFDTSESSPSSSNGGADGTSDKSTEKSGRAFSSGKTPFTTSHDDNYNPFASLNTPKLSEEDILENGHKMPTGYARVFGDPLLEPYKAYTSNGILINQLMQPGYLIHIEKDAQTIDIYHAASQRMIGSGLMKCDRKCEIVSFNLLVEVENYSDKVKKMLLQLSE